MSVRVRVRGAEQMKALGLELRAAGEEGKVFRRELLAGIRAAAKPAADAVKGAARRDLPSSGGLNELVATSRIGIRNRLTGKSVGVRVAGTKGEHNLRRIDRGYVRHRVFGVWRENVPDQKVTPGWFSETLAKSEPKIQLAVYGVIASTRRKLERR